MHMRKSCQGYTLVEISISILVIGIGLVSVLSIFPVGIKWTRKANANVTGSMTAKAIFNIYYSEGLGGPPAVPGTPLGTVDNYKNGYWFDIYTPAAKRVIINCYTSDFSAGGQFHSTNDHVGTFEGYVP